MRWQTSSDLLRCGPNERGCVRGQTGGKWQQDGNQWKVPSKETDLKSVGLKRPVPVRVRPSAARLSSESGSRKVHR